MFIHPLHFLLNSGWFFLSGFRPICRIEWIWSVFTFIYAMLDQNRSRTFLGWKIGHYFRKFRYRLSCPPYPCLSPPPRKSFNCHLVHAQREKTNKFHWYMQVSIAVHFPILKFLFSPPCCLLAPPPPPISYFYIAVNLLWCYLFSSFLNLASPNTLIFISNALKQLIQNHFNPLGLGYMISGWCD